MNRPIDIPAARPDPGEWLAQEEAMRRERLHLDPRGEDARTSQYRLLARMLRQPPPQGPDPDFAQHMTRLVERPRIAGRFATTLERRLTLVLAGVFVFAAITVTALYGRAWWPSFEALRPAAGTTQWLLALCGCLGLNLLLGLGWRRPRRPGGQSQGLE